ncbi:riboflavin synthase [Alphaproteobacteria bacterium]|nr:riboflavin synthase [Alphaproteobacteria bacterium]
MFTGIVSHIGKIENITHPSDWELSVKVENNKYSSDFNSDDLLIGASVSCSGICLTLKKRSERILFFDVSDETVSKTNFLEWKVGDFINLEKSLKVGDEIGGHFVYGHVDTTATVKEIKQINGSFKVVFSVNKNFMKYFAPKGSITIDGVSLTINEIKDKTFAVNIVPFTWDNTSFKNYILDTIVNVEIDILARYLERINASK